MLLLLTQSVSVFANILHYLILFRVILGWLPIGRNNPAVQFLWMLTEPILAPIRRLLQNSPLGGGGMMLDFSPILAFLFINVATGVIINFLISLA